MVTPADCDACREAERWPMTGLSRAGCPQCWARSVARLPHHARQQVYRATPPQQVEAFVTAVQAAWQRIQAAKDAARPESTFTAAGHKG